MGTEAVVVEVQVLEGHVRREEGDNGCLRVEAKGIVVEVDGVEVREVEDGGEERGKGIGDFAEESSGENIVEASDLCGC